MAKQEIKEFIRVVKTLDIQLVDNNLLSAKRALFDTGLVSLERVGDKPTYDEDERTIIDALKSIKVNI